MNRDALIFPLVKRTVSVIAWALVCAACLAALSVLTATTRFDISVPAVETLVVSQYIASVCLAVLAPWCVRVLLAGQGGPLLRAAGYVLFCLAPLSLLLTGAEAPLLHLADYYAGLLSGRGSFTQQGHDLMQSFRHIGMLLCTIATLIALIGWKRTQGYPVRQRRLQQAWVIAWLVVLVTELLARQLPALGIRPGQTAIALLYLTHIAGQLAYWALTAWLASLLARHAPRILDMPQREHHHFADSRKRTGGK